jgi:hypothetical protein
MLPEPDAARAGAQSARPAPSGQHRGDLSRHSARALDHIEPAVAESRPLDHREAVVALHIAELTDSLVAGAAVQFNQ